MKMSKFAELLFNHCSLSQSILPRLQCRANHWQSGLLLMCTLALAACGGGGGGSSPTDPDPDPVLVALTVAHADPAWDGVSVPAGQQCQSQGGVNPSTPSILVSKIPGGSDAIILEFSDRDFPPMDDGGHGKVGFMISEGTEDAVIPSIPGHTFILPEGFFLIEAHQAPDVDTAGAYMPPCSGGIGNSYYVTVRAVKLISADGKTFTPLGEGILELGSY